MAKGERIVAGQRDVADAGERDSFKNLVIASGLKGEAELNPVDRQQGAAEDGQRPRQDQRAEADANPVQQGAVSLQPQGPAGDKIGRLWGTGQAILVVLRHAPGGSLFGRLAYKEGRHNRQDMSFRLF